MRISFWRGLVLAGSAGLGATLAATSTSPALTSMARDLAPGQKGVMLAQLVFSTNALAMLITAPAMGWCAERIGYRRMLLMAAALLAVAGVAGTLADTLWMLVTSRFFVGVASGTLVTCSLSLMTYYFEGRARDRILGITGAALALVGITGSAAAGFMVVQFGWHSVFLLNLFSLPLLLIGFFVITDHEGQRSPMIPPPAAPSEKAPLAALAGILVVLLWITMVSMSAPIQLPFLMSERGIRDPRLVSLFVTGMSLIMLVISMAFDWLMVRLGIRGMLALMLAFVGVSQVIMGSSHEYVFMLIGALFTGPTTAFIKPVGASYILGNLPSSMHGRAMGSLVSSTFLGLFLNPLMFSPLNATFGIGSSLVLVGAITLVFALLLALPLPFYSRGKSAVYQEGN